MFQINLHNGFNFLIKASEQSKYLISSSIVYDLDKKKVLENIPIEEKKNAFVFSGKSRGLFGEIVKIYPKNLLIKFDEFEKELPKKIILVYDSKSKVTLFKK
jgi:ribosomal protein S4E